MTVDDGRRRKSTFAGLLLVLSALAAAFARRRPWEDGPGVIAGRRNLRAPLLELTSDPRSVAQREPSPAVMRLYVSVSSIERMMGAAGGVDFLMNGHWTALVDFGSLRQTYPHVEVLDARADVGQEDALLGHGTTRAMFALQRGRPEDFACLLDDDLVINVPILQRELQDKCQSEHCIMGEILGHGGEQRTAGGVVHESRPSRLHRRTPGHDERPRPARPAPVRSKQLEGFEYSQRSNLQTSEEGFLFRE
ncbi:hypothetical protein THAOC_20482 [Thalassiosira oceanica]|uniref:Hexosyltransferase n=1 Tax=Thalassiosira oceanica TaxID=159749 RepID=K0S3B0_THAOC|nr:hypothetical protein THAOC_20482 [Thalassiosira oceanica]|eukprot:EJK59314.1 hypothetical protein THAOC_20482 [Thalassiosira oceanica]